MLNLFCHFLAAGYPAAQSSTQGYSQSSQGYGASGYDTAPTAAAPASSQSYGSQSAYTAQTAYPGYGQQAAPTAPQAYVSTYLSYIHFSTGAFYCWTCKITLKILQWTASNCSNLVCYCMYCQLTFALCPYQLQCQQPAIQLQSE